MTVTVEMTAIYVSAIGYTEFITITNNFRLQRRRVPRYGISSTASSGRWSERTPGTMRQAVARGIHASAPYASAPHASAICAAIRAARAVGCADAGDGCVLYSLRESAGISTFPPQSRNDGGERLDFA